MATAPKKLTFICSWKSDKEVSFRLPFRQTPAARQHVPCERLNTGENWQEQKHTISLVLMQVSCPMYWGISLGAHTLSITETISLKLDPEAGSGRDAGGTRGYLHN